MKTHVGRRLRYCNEESIEVLGLQSGAGLLLNGVYKAGLKRNCRWNLQIRVHYPEVRLHL